MFGLRKLITFLLILGVVAVFASPSKAAENLTFQGRNTLHLSIDTYKTTSDGWTPIMFSLLDLEFSLWMDATGRVFESPQPKLRGPRPLFIIDLTNNTLNLRDRTFPFLIRSQNERRTRIFLLPKDLSVTLTISIETKRATLHLEKTQFNLGLIKAEFIEIEPGIHELKFAAPNVLTTEKFIFFESTETLYVTHEQKGAIDISRSRIWLKKVRQGGGR
jgi:hypothetical protein